MVYKQADSSSLRARLAAGVLDDSEESVPGRLVEGMSRCAVDANWAGGEEGRGWIVVKGVAVEKPGS
jgi:hypothetical protein